MFNIQLFVENQEVDLFDDESITLTQSLQDVKDIEKVFTDFSRTFNVPASKNNNKIFKHFYNYHIIGFDARRKKSATLYLNGEVFKEGRIKLEGATRKDNKAHTYKLTFFGNGINIKDLIGEDNLSTLDFLKNFTFIYNDANIKTYLQNGLDITIEDEIFTDSIIFPLISHSKRFIYDSGFAAANENSEEQNNIAYENGASEPYANGLQLSQLKPALRVYPIIKAIERQYGIVFSEDFFSTTNEPFYNLYMWLHNKTGGLFEDEGNVTYFNGFTVTDNNDDVIDITGNNFTTPKISHSGKKQERVRSLSVTVTSSVDTPFSFIIFKDGKVFERYDDIELNDNLEWRDLQHDNDTQINLEAGTYTFGIESDTPSVFDATFMVQRKAVFPEIGKQTIKFTAQAEVLSDVEVTVNNQLPDIKVIDFLTGIFKMFNLTSFEKDGTVEVKTLDEFYASSTKIWDATEFIDKTEQSVDSVLPYKQVDLKYSGLDNFFAKNHRELFYQDWGRLDYKASDKFEGQRYEITLPFEHFKYERLKDINGDSFTDLQWGWSADIKQQPNLGKPLLFYPIQVNATIGVIESDGDLVEHTGVFIPSNSVSTNDSVSINFSAELNEYGLVPYKQTLFSNYYEKYVKEIFDPQRRLTTTKAYLPLNIILNLTLADKVQIFENLYKINKLTTNFETNQSTLELINVKEQAGELITVEPIIPDKFIPNANCITVDDTGVSVSNVRLKVSSDCSFDGQGIKSTKEVIPSDIEEPNEPEQTETTVPLVVTKATLSDVTQPDPTSTTIYLKHNISVLGKIGNTPNLDEYGFFYSTTESDLDSDNIDTLKTTATHVPILTTSFNKHTFTGDVTHQVTGLSSGDTVYWRFYARTNTNEEYAFADAITEKKENATTLGCSGVSYNYIQLRNWTAADNTISYLDNGAQKTFVLKPWGMVFINGCICYSSLTSSGEIKIYDLGTEC